MPAERTLQSNQGRSDGEERFQLLMKSVKDYAIIMLDESGFVVSWNEGAQRIKGFSEEEILGQHFSVFYPPDDIESGKPDFELKVAATNGRFEEDGWRLRKDGSRFFANVVISPMVDDNGQIRGFAKVTRDITERRNAQLVLRKSEERFRLLVSGVRDYAIFMLDKEGFIASWNEGACHIKGYAEEEIVGKHFSVFYPQNDIDSGKPADELKIATTTGRFEEEGWRLRKDGSRFLANVVISSLMGDDGKLCGFAKITRDITEKKEAENRTKEFYSVLSHELRSPLTSIRGTLGVLEGGLVGNLSSEALEVTTNARFSCDRLIRLVNDLLDLSKLDANQFHLKAELLLPEKLVNEVTESMRTFDLQKSDIRIGVLENVPISGDHDRLVQVLTNLIANAIKFSPPGSAVEVEVRANAEAVTFFVKDAGPGIPLAVGNKLFTKFYQIDSSDSRSHEGTGLGLAISKAIVEQHGGAIGYTSQLGNGSTFWFSLPTGQQSIV